MFKKKKVAAVSLNSSVRLPSSLVEYTKLGPKERSARINAAVEEFLNWDSYAKVDWSKFEPGDESAWLDAVTNGVEYKSRSKALLPPTTFTLIYENAIDLHRAIDVVEKHRPELKNKGISSGVIRSALWFQVQMGGISLQEDVEDDEETC